MSRAAHTVVVFVAFANDRIDGARYLRNLPEELRRVREATAGAVQTGLCEVVERANATVTEVLDVFQDPRYRDRVALFHFGGHAGSGLLLFESPAGAATVAHAGGLARYLGEQRGLELVFLNGCSTQGQVQDLLAAGVPAVIATSQSIDDEVATELSSRFYRALASGAPLLAAFTEATAAVQTWTGDLPTATYTTIGTESVSQERWPWDLYVAPGAEERVKRWSLPLAARNPLFGLPALPAIDLPLLPFKHLASFTREDAPVFFGRGRETRELFEAVTLPEAAPIVLLFGATGVGKSSLLAAGLQPRLEVSHDVLYLRRDGSLGLTGTLAGALAERKDSATEEADLIGAWRQREETAGRPLVVILDQVEETWTRPLAGGTEAQDFAVKLRSLFALRDNRPLGCLVLGFRKEWLAEALRLLDAEKLPRTRIEITHLDHDGIVEAVGGLASTDRLKRQYRLGLDRELPAIVADDLLEDPAATIAPVLQILLTRMWAQATKERPDAPHFSVELYQGMKRQGLLLDDFLEQQLSGLREWRPEVVGSGLALDLLAYHTTPVGTAETRVAAEVVERYGRRREVVELLERCKDRYLLTGTARLREGELIPTAGELEALASEQDRSTTRLAHDTLAPIVRRRFEASDLPGQQALRILEQRAGERAGGEPGAPLDEFDLTRVEDGERGMRLRTPEEERLIAASRRQADRRKRQRRSLQLAAVVAAVILLGAAALAWWQRQRALVSEQRSQDRARGAIAANVVADRPTEAGLILLEVQQLDSTPTASETLQETLLKPVEFATLTGHTAAVQAASFSPNGTRVVTAAEDRTARVWNAATGQLIATLTGHTGELHAASFSPDSSRVVTASKDRTARIWDAATGQPITTLKGHTDEVFAASFSPDSSRVLTASVDGTARIWDAATGKPIATLTHLAEVLAASFSAESTRVVTASFDNTSRIWNAATGKPIVTLKGHTGWVIDASFSRDGTRVVTASADHTARIWNAATGQPIATLTGHTAWVIAASFSRDGAQVVTASTDHTARIWNAGTGQPIAILTGHADDLKDASFSPDGTQVVTASSDGTARIWNAAQPRATQQGSLLDPEAKEWNAATGQLIAILTAGQTGGVSTASFSPDGTRVVTASDDATARIWNVATGQAIGATLWQPRCPIEAASFSPGGSRVVTICYYGVRIWNAATGQLITTLEARGALSFSSDGSRIVACGDQTTACIWNAATGQPIATLKGHTGSVLAAAFSRDGSRVVTASVDRTARIWNAVTGQPILILTGHTDQLKAASFSPDGTRVVTASDDTTARIWNAVTGQPIATLKGHTGKVVAAAFSRNGTRVVTASEDATARIWNAATGQPIFTLTGHATVVTAASFSPDGTRVVTASWDRTARIWNAVTGQPILTLTGHTDELTAASFSPDGIRLVTAALDGTARIWPIRDELRQSQIRSRTRLCLPASFREVNLGEGPQEAEVHEKACNACVPEFFARLKGVPSGDWLTYLSAWREYRECLDRAT